MYWTHWFGPNSSPLNKWNLSELEHYMLNTSIHIDRPPEKVELKEKITEQPLLESLEYENQEMSLYEKCKSRLLYVEKCQDPLFWSLYIYHYGMKEYLRVGKYNGNEEMKIKKEIVDHVLKTGSKEMTSLLNTKFTKVGCNKIAEDILTKPKTTMDLLYPYCLFFKCNIYVVDLNKKIYLKYAFQDTSNSDIDQLVIYRNPEKKYPEYFVDIGEQLYTISYIQSQFMCLDSYNRPLKAVSNFKTNELEYIAKELGIELSEKKKKAELYHILSQHCAWDYL